MLMGRIGQQRDDFRAMSRHSFLGPIVGEAAHQFHLRNERTGAIVAVRLITAFDSASRRTGLLHHQALSPGTAMIIAPTSAIHTFFMRFPIDVAFVARDGRVLKSRAAMRPWRMSAAFGAHAAVELPAGALAASNTRP